MRTKLKERGYLNYKTYYQVTKTMLYWQNNRQTGQWDEVENPETDLSADINIVN